MKKIVSNTFGKGLNMDLNPLSTPKDVLTDCLNGTVITYNGDEFNLQTDLGNVRATAIGETNDMPNGFIPIGMKEFNNILYVVAHNPITRESKVGSIPSPQRYLPIYNKDTDNLVTKSIQDTNGTSIWELTNGLSTSGQINHGMNTLTSFLKRGDKYKIDLSLKGITNTSTANDILKKFINNYNPEEGAEGYFDLKYFSFNSEGILTELPINITPDLITKTSDIAYSPSPFSADNSTNGVVKVMDKEGSNIIIAAFIPKSIEKFDFKLQSYNSGEVLRAKVVFSDNLISEGNSAIKLNTIEIATKNIKPTGEESEEIINYYDYKQYGTSQYAIIENTDGSSFQVGTLISTTCTPIDQFGRRLTDKAVTRVYEVGSILLGTEAHNIFKYKVVGDVLTLTYNFSNGLSETTNVEFYDFWSGVSKLIKNIAFNNGTETTIEVALSDIPTTNIFVEGSKYGGIPIDTLSLPTPNEHILGSRITSSSLRKNHCYLVRIYGVDNGIDFSVFQLLYTLPIPIFVDSYLVTGNFGIIDIVEGMLGKSLTFTTTGELFNATPIEKTIDSYTVDSVISNYANEGNLDYSKPFRLYGGPVFEEENNGIIATWNDGDAYYRNLYTQSFAKVGPGILKIGYHEFPESSIGTLLTENEILGASLPVELFINQSKNYLRGGLTAAGTSSQKDFKFNLSSYIKGVAPILQGSVSILPSYIHPSSSLVTPLLFGNIDMESLTKQIKLGNFVGTPNTVINLSTSSITETLNWNEGSPTVSSKKSAKLATEISSEVSSDLITIKDFEIQTQRYIYGDSGFKYYLQKFARNKLFRYFAMKHTQTMRVKVILDSDYNDLTKHVDYLFSGSMDDVDIKIGTINNTSSYGVMSKFKLMRNPLFEATLVWNSTPTGNIADILTGMGVETTMPLNTTSAVNLIAGSTKNDSKILKFLSYTSNSNTVEQYVYKTFKSSLPLHIKIGIDDPTSPLYTDNNMWKWNDSANMYIAVGNTISEDYLNNLIIYQNYQEIILAQYPKTNIVYNTNSTTSITMEENSIEYFVNINQSSLDKHLTKSCFGSSTMEPFSIRKFTSIIDDWSNRYKGVIRILYNFTDINLSEGDAKNIPWTYSNSSLSKIGISDISVSMSASTPNDHVEWFTNADSILNSSPILKYNGYVAPTIKAIINGSAQNVKTDFITVETRSSLENINKSELVTPIFNKSALLTKVQPIITNYGVNYKLSEPPSISQIYMGLNIKLGDIYAGGVVFKLYYDNNGAITGGLVAANTGGDYTPKAEWYMRRSNDHLDWAIGSRDLNNGWANTQIMLANENSKDLAVKLCVDHRGGGYTDWYMPALNELKMLRDYSLNTSKPVLIKDAVYWSSTEEHYDKGEEWAYVVKVVANAPLQSAIERSAQYVHPIRKF